MAKHRALRWGIWFLVVLGAASAAGYWYWSRERQNGEEKYRTEVVDRGDVKMTVTATGSISAVITVQVGSQVSGIISRLYADFNSEVKNGQLLAELDPTSFQTIVAQRRADLLQNEVQMRNAEISFHRQERLLRENLAPQSDYDAAKAVYEAARAQVEQSAAALRQAETNLEYTKIVSPIDGVVVARQYDVGQTVAASFQAPTLFTIAQDLTKMQVQADVDQSDIGRVRVGQPVRFNVDAYPEEEFQAEISQIRLNATSNQNVITYPVIIEVPNPDLKLRPLMTANVTIEVAVAPDVLRIPNAALRFRPTDETGNGGNGRLAGGRATGSYGGPTPEQRTLLAAEARPGFGGAAAALAPSAGGSSTKRMQTVYVLGGLDAIRPAGIRTGISDGKFTQVLEGEVREGDRVVVGLATARVGSSSGRPPGMGRPF